MTKTLSPKLAEKEKRNKAIIAEFNERRESGDMTMGIVEDIKDRFSATGSTISVSTILRLIRNANKEENKLIAEFMGFPVKFYKEDEETGLTDSEGNADTVSYDCELAIINGLVYEPRNLKYHNSWDWLMPVVDKIENMQQMGAQAYIDISAFKITASFNYEQNGRYFTGNDKIEAVYSAVIQFIKWYNSNPIKP